MIDTPIRAASCPTCSHAFICSPFSYVAGRENRVSGSLPFGLLVSACAVYCSWECYIGLLVCLLLLSFCSILECLDHPARHLFNCSFCKCCVEGVGKGVVDCKVDLGDLVRLSRKGPKSLQALKERRGDGRCLIGSDSGQSAHVCPRVLSPTLHAPELILPRQ